MVLLFAGVGFSLYKAVASFSARSDSPDYQRSPSAQISPPAPETLFDFTASAKEEALRLSNEGFRFPDRALLTAGNGTQDIVDQIEAGSLTGQTFRSYGYSRPDADGLAKAIQSSYRRAKSKQGEKPMISINSVTDVSPRSLFLQTSALFTFYTNDSSDLPEQGLDFTWAPNREGSDWELRVIGNGFS